MAYITQEDLENALGANNVRAMFDDDGDGYVDEAAMAACLTYVSTQVDSFLGAQYPQALPLVTAPETIKAAAVDFAYAFAIRRAPEYASALGLKSFNEQYAVALATMKRFASAEQRIPEAVGQSTVNGVRYSTGGDDPFEERPRFFDDMGDFAK